MPLSSNGEAAMSPMLPAGPGPEAPVPVKHGSSGRPRDPNTCFFEGQQRPHGARWAPNYDPLCSLCTCQVGCLGKVQLATRSGTRGPTHLQSLGPSLQRRTVICDPVVCPPPSCPHPVQALDQCCPVCPGECPAGRKGSGGASMGKECSREGSRGHSLPHPFFVSTEKQRSRDLPSLPNLEPGEGK